jgi:hypothetical protein
MDPFKITEPTVISFSGGRTSAYMLWRVLQSNDGMPDEAIAVFANTGKEVESTLRFVRDCETNWGVEIHWVEWRRDDPRFERVNFETASRNGEPFEECIKYYRKLPNPVQRWCTGKLKIGTIHRYVKSLGWDHNRDDNSDFVGIRADEMRRAAKMRREKIPLVTAGVTKQDVMDFWGKSSFDLGLPVIDGQTVGGNCDLCFLTNRSGQYGGQRWRSGSSPRTALPWSIKPATGSTKPGHATPRSTISSIVSKICLKKPSPAFAAIELFQISVILWVSEVTLRCLVRDRTL